MWVGCYDILVSEDLLSHLKVSRLFLLIFGRTGATRRNLF
jgi:hypothetical protein